MGMSVIQGCLFYSTVSFCLFFILKASLFGLGWDFSIEFIAFQQELHTAVRCQSDIQWMKVK